MAVEAGVISVSDVVETVVLSISVLVGVTTATFS
jgi:hypothetical protein